MSTELVKLPTLAELTAETEMSIKENKLMVLLNQPPPENWLKRHPTATIENETTGQKEPIKYLPIQRVEYLLTRIFNKWWVEIRNTQTIANSVVVTVRLFVVSPRLGEEDRRTDDERTIWQDGLGAAVIQTKKGAGAMEARETLSDAVMKAAPAAESYAIKDAAEKFGKLFGKDLSRKDNIGYESLLKEKVSLDDLKELYELKKESLSPNEQKQAERILGLNGEKPEENSFKKLNIKLQAL